MDKKTLRVFLGEIDNQCRFATIAAHDFDRALQSLQTSGGAVSAYGMDRLWYSVHAYLSAVANVSKMLWPPCQSESSQQRGVELRRILTVGDDSVFKSRSFRNHFEHFDERLESFVDSTTGPVVDKNIGDGPSSGIAGPDARNMLRNLDTRLMAVTFRGDSYRLQSIMDTVRALREKTAKEIANLQS